MQGVDSGVRGFTLIELSIVLVVIGLVVGGVLVGQDLIRAAYVRAQITQIEKFNTAVNTFYGKYQALPGDMNLATAQTFGFSTTGRGGGPGLGDGNGVLEESIGASQATGSYPGGGEQAMFWVDLSSSVAGGLIDGGFNTASFGTPAMMWPPTYLPAYLASYFPAAKIGGGNYICAASGGYYEWLTNSPGTGDGRNYFVICNIQYISLGLVYGTMGLTVSQAYNIDNKTDDGLPQSGRVMAVSTNGWAPLGTSAYNPTTLGPVVGGDGVSTPSSSTTCYDNGGSAGKTETYSMEVSGGANLNCWLSFRMQAGD